MRDRTPKRVVTGPNARSRLLAGAETVARAAGVTLGPEGRTVLLDRASGIISTKDGVTVAREIVLADPVAQMGAALLRDACAQVSRDVGDGTTSTAVITACLLAEGQKLIAAGYGPLQVARRIQEAVPLAERVIGELTVPVETQEMLEQVAFLASNGDSGIARMLAEGAMASGKNGALIIEDGYGNEDELLLKEGMEIDRGWANELWRHPEGKYDLEAPLIAIVPRRLICLADVQSILEEATQFGGRPLIVIAPSVESEALMTMGLNLKGQRIESYAIGAPGFGDLQTEMLKDLAALSQATFVDPAAGMNHREFKHEWFGSLRKVTIREKTSVLIAYDDAQASIDARVAQIKREGESLTSDFDRDVLHKRIGKLTGGLAILRVGGVTEAALKERRARVEDALGAVKAALKGGAVPGAGSTYLTIADELEDLAPDPVYRALAKALREPLRLIAQNAGEDGRAVVERVRQARAYAEWGDWAGWVGWDAREDVIRDLGDETKPPIVDPALAVSSVIRAAFSTSAMLLSAEGAIVFKRGTNV